LENLVKNGNQFVVYIFQIHAIQVQDHYGYFHFSGFCLDIVNCYMDFPLLTIPFDIYLGFLNYFI